MITTDDLVGAYARNANIVRSQTEGLTHADSLLQVPFGGNCMNWVLGHFAGDRNLALQQLGEEGILTEAQSQRYGYGSEPVCADGDDILKLETLLELLETSQERLAAALARATPETLAREVKSHLGTTTLGQSLFFRYWHETYHVGQLEQLRELAGANDKVI